MATCKWCNKSGFLMGVNQMGVCKTCAIVIDSEVSETRRLVKDSNDLIENSKVLDTRLSRCDFLIELFGRLSKYETKGIPVIDPLPSKMTEYARTLRSGILSKTLLLEWAIVIADSTAAKTTKAKLRHLTKFADKIRIYQEKYPDSLQLLMSNVQDEIDKANEIASDN